VRTREEHIRWAKTKALKHVTRGDFEKAFRSMVSCLNKHKETRGHIAIELGLNLMINGFLNNEKSVRDYINGFN